MKKFPAEEMAGKFLAEKLEFSSSAKCSALMESPTMQRGVFGSSNNLSSRSAPPFPLQAKSQDEFVTEDIQLFMQQIVGMMYRCNLILYC